MVHIKVLRHFYFVINEAVANYYSLAALLRYAVKSALSAVFLMPAAKVIFVPGMYVLGSSKCSISVSSPQVTPLFCSHPCKKIPGPDLSFAQTDHGDLAQSYVCLCLPFPQCGTGHTSEQKPTCLSQQHPFLNRSFFARDTETHAREPDVPLSPLC